MYFWYCKITQFTLSAALQLSPWSKLAGLHFSLFVSLSVIWPPSIHSFSVQFSPPIPNNNMCFSKLQKQCIKNAAFLLYCCRPGRGCAGRVQPVLQETVLCGSVLSGRRWCGTAQTEDHTAAQTEGMSFKMYWRNVTSMMHVLRTNLILATFHPSWINNKHTGVSPWKGWCLQHLANHKHKYREV